MIVGLLHPGEMGAAIGSALLAAGHEVLWASDGRSEATRTRAAGFSDAGTVAELVARSEVVFSVVPPQAALELAESLPPFSGIFVDANAVSPATAGHVGAAVGRFVDGGIVGGPPTPRLYLSGAEAARVAALFEGSLVETQIVANASAVKCAYAAWTKGSGALLLRTAFGTAIRPRGILIVFFRHEVLMVLADCRAGLGRSHAGRLCVGDGSRERRLQDRRRRTFRSRRAASGGRPR